MNGMRVWAEIDLDGLTHNLAVIRQLSGPGVRLMLVVKADAYGHGAVGIAHHAVRAGIGALGVGTSEEALELREAGIRTPILVLGTVIDEEIRACLVHDVHLGVHTSDRLSQLAGLAAAMERPAKVHLNVDTGMGRLGVPPARALELLRKIAQSPHLELAGIMSHLAATRGALDPSGQAQVRSFDAFLDAARAITPNLGWIHMANSAGISSGLGSRYDTVRPGLAAYGAMPNDLPGAEHLRPVMRLRSQVVFLKDLPQGAPVGYESTWRAEHPTRIATLPIGYADGLPWRASPGGAVLIRGQRAPIVGRISMDYTTVDVGQIRDVAVGDRATLIGCDGGETIRLGDVARWADTIPYEISCSLGRRVHRRYVGGEDLPVPSQSVPPGVLGVPRALVPNRPPVQA
ncbi:MAG: alanine racemase [Planctomycetes bacterium]|nr:alanine racemase [Planctomycetota bacterium]MCB9908844.1 alanine racemase [Planctomycetota bacterium]